MEQHFPAQKNTQKTNTMKDATVLTETEHYVFSLCKVINQLKIKLKFTDSITSVISLIIHSVTSNLQYETDLSKSHLTSFLSSTSLHFSRSAFRAGTFPSST